MTEQELISKLTALKTIEPRKDWVVSLKTELFSVRNFPAVAIAEPSLAEKFWANVSVLFRQNQKKLAYAFAALAVVAIGSFGIMSGWLGSSKVAPVTPAVLAEAKTNVELLKEKSKNLSDIVASDPKSAVAVANDVKQAAQQLTEKIQKDPQLAKEVALEVNNNKTYLDIPGNADLKNTSNELYKTIDKQMIEDLDNTTLTESQQASLGIAKNLYGQERYADALESILLLNMAIKSN